MGGYISPADGAGLSLEDFLAGQVEAVLGSHRPQVVSHYTTAQGMSAILRSGTFRAHPLSRMNDMAEGRFAASVFRAHLDRLYALEAPGPFLDLLSAMRQRMDEGLDLKNVFSASFSREADEAGMWNLYADRGTGFSFSIPLLHGSNWVAGQLWKCHYGERPLIGFCKAALSKARELLREGQARGEEEKLQFDVEPSTIDEFAQVFLNRIGQFAPAFKPEAWADEDEWRWVFVTSPYEEKKYQELSLKESSGKLAISCICAGPLCEPSKICEIEQLLRQTGCDNIQLCRSSHSSMASHT